MKKWLYPICALLAIGILSRLPHPARDIAMLEPVRAVYLYMDEQGLRIETDTGDSGTGTNLRAAYADLRSGADGEIFLDTAEFLLLGPEVTVTEDFYTLFRPGCKAVFTAIPPALQTVADYLSIHTPSMTLAQIRASGDHH